MMYPKREYVRSPALLRACRQLHCQLCGASDGTIVAAHSNAGEHGKGRAIKADDNRVAALCHRCHHEIDQGHRLSAEERSQMWLRAHTRTVASLTRRGLWPADVPVPAP